jgi:2-haloacid dehalogenase
VKTILFDVNETLLDLAGLRPRFRKAFGSDELVASWFGQLLRHSMVATLTDAYQPFDVLAVDALQIVAAKAGTTLSDSEATYVVDGMRELSPHPDVHSALTSLREHGFRLLTLTNSPPDMLADQLGFADIRDLFDDTLSVDAVGKFKPHPDTYRYAADSIGVPIGEVRLVAAHDWDVSGAIRAGASAAFVARPGMMLTPVSVTPDIVAPDLDAVAAEIIAKDG